MSDVSKLSDVAIASIAKVDGVVKASIGKLSGIDFGNEVHVFVLAGQSNMVGRAPFDGGADYPTGTLQYPKTTYPATTTIAAVHQLLHWDPDAADMGLAINFAVDYLALNDVQLVFIPAADGGTGFIDNEWNPGDAKYNHVINATNALMTANPSWLFKGILWHQGETDFSNANFADQFYLMIQSMRKGITTATQETPFILGELLVGGTRTTALNSGVLTDTPVYNYRTALVSSTGLTSTDSLHFDSSSLRTFGTRYEDSYTTLNNPYPTAETGALGDWIFGNSNQLYIDLTGSAVQLTAQNSATQVYTLGDTTISAPISGPPDVTQGLISGIAETDNFTMCLVFKYTGSSLGTILNGNLGTSALTSDGQSFFVSGANDLRWNERGGAGLQTLRLAADLTVGDYYFIASSVNEDDDFILMLADAGETSGSFEVTGTGAGRSVGTGRNMGVGNAHYTDATFSGTATVAEAIFFNTAKTLAELRDIANRSRTRLAARNITVV